MPKGIYKHIGRPLSESHKIKIGLANLGKKKSLEHRINMSKAQKGKKLSEETRKKISKALKGKMPKNLFQKGYTPWNKGIPMLEETKKKMSESRNGHIVTKETREKIRQGHLGIKFSEEHRKKLSGAKKGKYTGERASNWKGGLTSINHAIRNSLEYEEWRTKVFERDLYTCQDCGQIGGYLEADHIKTFSLYPELRFEVSNGKTLCKPCHKIKTREDLEQNWNEWYGKRNYGQFARLNVIGGIYG